MARIVSTLEQKYSIHEDGWTETLAGVSLLINQIENSNNQVTTPMLFTF